MRRFTSLSGRLVLEAVLVSAALVPTLSCTSRELAQPNPSVKKEERINISVSQNRDVDILFVIDDSSSMKQEQDSLALNFVNFINVLSNIPDQAAPGCKDDSTKCKSLPNVHIAVISPNMGDGVNGTPNCDGKGDDGAFQNMARIPGCTAPSGLFIRDVAGVNGVREKNYPADKTLQETFSCIAKLGIAGCGFEQHLASVKRALERDKDEALGFLRPDAYLAVIVLADEDDCSSLAPRKAFNRTDPTLQATLGPLTDYRCLEFGVTCDGMSPPRTVTATYNNCEPARNSAYFFHTDEYVKFLKGLKPEEPRLVIVAAIVGPPEPFSVIHDPAKGSAAPANVCGSTGNAEPSPRFSHFVNSFDDDRATLTSICKDDLSDALNHVSDLLARAISSPCLSGNVDPTDSDPNAVGIQLDCIVSDEMRTGDKPGDVVTSDIPACQMMETGADKFAPLASQTYPCYWFNHDDGLCAQAPNLALTIERNGQEPPRGTEVVVKCAGKS